MAGAVAHAHGWRAAFLTLGVPGLVVGIIVYLTVREPKRGRLDAIVDEINGKKIDTIKDMAAAFAEKPEFYVIKFIGRSRPLVLERSAVEAARARIKARYNVLEEQNIASSETSPAP